MCVLIVLVFSILVSQISCGELKPIDNKLEDTFDPKETPCTHDSQALEKYLKRSGGEPKISGDLQKKISTSVNDFVKKNDGSNIPDFIANHLAKEGGEIASWVTALVTASFAIAGVVTQASAVLGVISPGVGVISWVAGIYSSHQEKKEKKQLLQHIQKNFDLMNTKMDSQFKAMKDYVDDSIISSDYGRLEADLQQMNLYLSDCLLIEDKAVKERCLEDRCSYVKSGFEKFALFSEHLLSVKPDPAVGENVKDKTRLSPVNKKNAQEILKKMSSQDVKRVFANINTFNTYVSTVLMRCEMYRVLKKQYPDPSKGSKKKEDVDDIFDILDSKANDWNVKDRVLNYLENSFYVVYEAHLSTKPKVEAVGYVRDALQDKTKFTRKSRRMLQCRFKMNDYFSDICDKEYHTDVTEMDEELAEQGCDMMIKLEKKEFAESVDLSKIISHTNFFEMRNLLLKLYQGPKEEEIEHFV